MRYLRIVAFALLPVLLMALAGCGSSGSSSSDPFAGNSGTGTKANTIFGNISTPTGKTGITLATNTPTVDVDNGQVLATATVVENGEPVAGVPVTFAVVAPANGPAAIEAGLTTVRTNSNGVAVTRVTTRNNSNNTLTTTNVIISATVSVGSQTAMANASFQIVRGGGVIMFLPNAGAAPTSQSNILEQVDREISADEGAPFAYYQLIPFKVTDSNGNARVGVPVTISVYSVNSSDDFSVYFLAPSLMPTQTVTTDSAGQGIFNARVGMIAPPPGGSYVVSAIFKAVTNDANQVTAYVGGSYQLRNKEVPPVTITPSTAMFGGVTDISLTIAGGLKPYAVSSSDPTRVTVTADGTAVVAHLQNPGAWTGSVVIKVVDSKGNSAAATISRGLE